MRKWLPTGSLPWRKSSLALQGVPGMRSVKVYSGAGGLRADMRYVFEMDDAGVYERLLATRSTAATRRQNLCGLGHVHGQSDVFA